MDWLDGSLGESPYSFNDKEDTFYCPYTNGAECALTTKGWQPQELCDALECEQLKFFQAKRKKKRFEAA